MKLFCSKILLFLLLFFTIISSQQLEKRYTQIKNELDLNQYSELQYQFKYLIWKRLKIEIKSL